MFKFISNDSRRKIKNINNIKQAYLKLTSDIFKQIVISKELNKPLNTVKICLGKFGKPFVQNNKNFNFNLSHTDKMIAIGVANQSIGIDIETIKLINDSVMRHYYSDEEKELIKKSSNPNEEYTRIWTLKESYIKNIGYGFSNKFEIRNFNYDVIDKKYKIESLKGYSFWTTMIDYHCLTMCIKGRKLRNKDIDIEKLCKNDLINYLMEFNN